jgi:phosphoribosylformylglycinamidine synthase
MIPCEDSQILYIPFDTASFKLGGSLLAELKGHNGGPAPYIMDPDYFIDCYEVVREMVEDGIVMAGATVGDGGIACAAGKMCINTGMNLNISGIMSSYMEEDSTKILFSEVPGVLIQVSESNLDYVDSQLILQDVAYYSLGGPLIGKNGIEIDCSRQATVAGILASLIGQASEGED